MCVQVDIDAYVQVDIDMDVCMCASGYRFECMCASGAGFVCGCEACVLQDYCVMCVQVDMNIFVDVKHAFHQITMHVGMCVHEWGCVYVYMYGHRHHECVCERRCLPR